MADTHGLTNAGYSIDFNGRTLTFKALTDNMRARISKEQRQRALSETLDLKGTLPPRDYAEQLSRTRDKISGGFYDFGSPWHNESIQTIQGIAIYIRAVTNTDLSDDEIFHLMTEHGETVGEYLKLLNGVDEDAAVP